MNLFSQVLLIVARERKRSLSSLALFLKTCASEHVRQSRSTWLQGIEALQCIEWQLSMQRYWCLSVSLTYKLVRILLFSR